MAWRGLATTLLPKAILRLRWAKRRLPAQQRRAMPAALVTILVKLLRFVARWFWARRGAPANRAFRRTLVLKPCCLGDVLLSTPLVAAIRAANPGAEITYAVGPWSRPMVASSEHIDALVTLPERWTPGNFVAVAREL